MSFRNLKFIVGLAGLVIAAGVAQSAAATIIGPDGFIVRSNGTYWQVPYNGGPASMVTVPLPNGTATVGGMTYGDNIFLAFVPRSYSVDMMYSKDGKKWTRKMGTISGRYSNGMLKSVLSVNGKLVGINAPFAGGMYTCITADQGSGWHCDAAIPDVDEGVANPVTTCGDFLVAKAGTSVQSPSGWVDTGLVDFSKDGVNWTQTKNLGGRHQPLYCAAGQVWTNKAMTIRGHAIEQLSLITPVGATQKGQIINEAMISGIASDGEKLFVYGDQHVYISTDDGKSFTKHAMNLRQLMHESPVYSHGLFVAVSGDGVVESRDGIRWQPVH